MVYKVGGQLTRWSLGLGLGQLIRLFNAPIARPNLVQGDGMYASSKASNRIFKTM